MEQPVVEEIAPEEGGACSREVNDAQQGGDRCSAPPVEVSLAASFACGCPACVQVPGGSNSSRAPLTGDERPDLQSGRW